MRLSSRLPSSSDTPNAEGAPNVQCQSKILEGFRSRTTLLATTILLGVASFAVHILARAEAERVQEYSFGDPGNGVASAPSTHDAIDQMTFRNNLLGKEKELFFRVSSAMGCLSEMPSIRNKDNLAQALEDYVQFLIVNKARISELGGNDPENLHLAIADRRRELESIRAGSIDNALELGQGFLANAGRSGG